MCKKILFLSILLLFTQCTSETVVPGIETPPPLENVLTLELSFGADEENIKEEFLLAIPYGIEVNDDNDILVTDENRIKIFDSDGKEKMIIGGTGEGPGEFSYIRKPFLSPTGYLTVNDGRTAEEFNLFSPEYEFLSRLRFMFLPSCKIVKQRYNYTGIELGQPFKIVSMDEKERIFSANASRGRGDSGQKFDILVYDRPDTTLLLAEYIETNSIVVGIGGHTFPNLGRLLWEVLPDRRILYIHTGHDKILSDNKATYILNVVSMDNLETNHIKHTYTPIEISDSDMGEYKKFPDLKPVADFLKEKKYWAPLQKLLIDGYTLFALTLKNNEKGEIFTDVFDLQSGTYMKSVYFPEYFKFEIEIIKNGYAYRTAKNEEGFYIIEKYKIDPAVYGN